MLYYQESFDAACKGFDDNVRNVVKTLFRKGSADAVAVPSLTATIRRSGGWVGNGPSPDLPRDPDVITEQDLEAYTAALTRNGFFGPDSWYMNHDANRAYSLASHNGGKLEMPVLFLHAAYDAVCETVTNSRMADPMRRDCHDVTEAVVYSGHWMAQEQPVAVNVALAKWLAAKLPDYWNG
jgi:pimeloyl-ACP methyl ester carboxylesterase